MTAEALSQEEIDALLRGETPPQPPAAITPEEENTIKEYSHTVSQAGCEVLSTLLGESANAVLGEFKETDSKTIGHELQGDFVAVEMNYKGMVQGKSLLIMSEENALKLAAQMTGGGAGQEFGDLEESAFGEAIQSILSSSNTTLAQKLGGEIQLDPPEITVKPPNLADLMPASSERSILLSYDLESGAVKGPLYQIIPRNLLHSIVSAASNETSTAINEVERQTIQSKSPPVMEAPAKFASMSGESTEAGGRQAPRVNISNLDLILDIQLEVTVELGRTHRKIRDVLELGPGSVVELDCLAGEPVDILVNDKLFAKGEVVVIDENFGVRITDILTIEERIEALK
ncbi:MAG: flagellar motor switch protein FliN [Candidatus Omnitrophica bacterium]|nr:flagellar motor switch protein FliN [Candidatus Omnitrophota bacterium]